MSTQGRPRAPLRRALLQRSLSFGSWLQVGHPASAEVVASAGFDWLAVDCEHTEIGMEGFTRIAQALGRFGTRPLVRVRENETLAIRQALDCGADGVIVPLVHDGGDAERAVAAAKYPPRGIRGFGFSRANNYGRDFDEYSRIANEETCVVVQIESRTGVERIDEILAVDGVDGILVGPYDLSASYGLVGQPGHATIVEASRQLVEACERAGKAAGVHVVVPTAENIVAAIEQGFTFIALGIDTVFLRHAAAAARTVALEASGRGDQI